MCALDETAAHMQSVGGLRLGHCANLRNVGPCALSHGGQPSCAHRPLRFVEVPPLDVGRDNERDGVLALEGLEARLHAGRAAGPNAVAAVENFAA